MRTADIRPFKRAERVYRQGWTLERQAIEGELRYWGPRYRRILLSEGYSSFSPFAGLLEGRSGKFTAKILIPDMTERAWEVNHGVWTLPTDYAWSLVARYCLPPKENGAMYSDHEISIALHCSPECYRKRLARARVKLQQRLFATCPI